MIRGEAIFPLLCPIVELHMNSTSIRRDFCLYYNGGATHVTADCTRTRTLAELLAETLFSSSRNDMTVLKDIETRYVCTAPPTASSPSSSTNYSAHRVVPFSIPTQLAPRELYLQGRGEENWIGSGLASSSTPARGRGRGRGRGFAPVGRPRGGGGRRRIESSSVSSTASSTVESVSDSTSLVSGEGIVEADGQLPSATRGRGRVARSGTVTPTPPPPRGRGRGRGVAAAAIATSSPPPSVSPPGTTLGVSPADGFIPLFPVKRKRGRPPKNPQAVLLQQQQQQAEAAAAAAAKDKRILEKQRRQEGQQAAELFEPPHPTQTGPTGAERRRRRAAAAEEANAQSRHTEEEVVAVAPTGSEEQEMLQRAQDEVAQNAAPAEIERCRLLAHQRRLLMTFSAYVASPEEADSVSFVGEASTKLPTGGWASGDDDAATLAAVQSAVRRAAALSPHSLPSDAAALAARLATEGRTPCILLTSVDACQALPGVMVYNDEGPLASVPTTSVTSSQRQLSAVPLDPPVAVTTKSPQSIVVPVVVGGCVRLINPESKEKSHRWTVYVRGLHNGHPAAFSEAASSPTAAVKPEPDVPDAGDPPNYLSDFIDYVTFILDRSFTPCVRTVRRAPFELTEVGWGEFVVSIHVHLKYAGHSPASDAVRQRLQTYFAGSGGRATLLPSTGPGRGASGLDPVTSITITNSNLGRGTQVNATSNTDTNALVDSLLDVNYNSAARSLYYRGPCLPPHLLSCESDDEYAPRPTSASSTLANDGGYFLYTPDGVSGGGCAVSCAEGSGPGSEADTSEGSGASSPLVAPSGDFSDLTESPLPEDSAGPLDIPTLLSMARRGPGRRPSAARLRAAAAAAAVSGVRGDGRTPPPVMGGPGGQALSEPGGSRRLVTALRTGHAGNVVVLSHLLRFSHRVKVPPAVPPYGDVRSPQRGMEQLGYVMVPEPVVTEHYDEIVIPLKGGGQTWHSTTASSSAAGRPTEVSSAARDSHRPPSVKKEPMDDTQEPKLQSAATCGAASEWTLAEDTRLLQAASRLEKSLRHFLYREHLRAASLVSTTMATGAEGGGDPRHRQVSVPPPPSPPIHRLNSATPPPVPSLPGGVSCWSYISTYGNALVRDREFALSYLKSVAATAKAEGWLACALQTAQRRYRESALPTTRPWELDLACALVEATGFTAGGEDLAHHLFTTTVLPHAMDIETRLLADQLCITKSTSQRQVVVFPLASQHSVPLHQRHRKLPMDHRQHGAAQAPTTLPRGVLQLHHQQPVGQSEDVAALSAMKAALLEEISAMRVESSRRQAALTMRQI